MTAIQIKDGEGLTDATRKAMVSGYQKWREFFASKINPNIIIQPGGECVFRDPNRKRQPLSGHVCDSSGRPAIMAQIEEHNRKNRARIYDRIRGWDKAFRIGSQIQFFGVAFRVHRHYLPDVIALDPLYPISRDHDWEVWFSECVDRMLPYNGYMLRIQSVYVDQLHMQVVSR